MTKIANITKLFILGLVLVFISGPAFRKLEILFYDDDRIIKDDRPSLMRHRFWQGSIGCFLFVCIIVAIHLNCFRFEPTKKYWYQIGATVLALAGTFCRAGWGIQTCSGETRLEIIDRGLFVISHLGATAILLFILIA